MNLFYEKTLETMSMDWKMQRYCSVFDTKERNLLLCGYIREEIRTHIPTDVIRICVMYYDDVIYWTLEDDELKALRSLKRNETLYYEEGAIKEQGIYIYTYLCSSFCFIFILWSHQLNKA